MTYPASIDELTDGVPADGAAATTGLDDATYPHDDHHRALAVAVEAIETELGTDPAGSESTVKDRIAAVETLAGGAPVALGHPLSNMVNSVAASGVPGVGFNTVTGTYAFSATYAVYSPMVVEKALTITGAELRVTTQSAGAETARIAIYEAANTWQPGNLVTGGDLGTVSTQTTGRKSIGSLSVALAAGIYLVRVHAQAACTLEVHQGFCPRWSFHHVAQNHAVQGTYAALTYAAAESPGTAASALIQNAGGVYTIASFTWTPT